MAPNQPVPRLSITALAVRAGIALLACIAIWKGCLALLPATTPGQRLLAGMFITALACGFLAIALRVDRLDASLPGLGLKRDVFRGACAGAGLWLLAAAPATAALSWLGVVDIRIADDWPSALATLAVLIPAVLLIEAVPEELLFRGYLQGMAARTLSPWRAVLLQAALFLLFAWAIGATATPGQWSFLPGFALILGGLRLMGGNLGWPIGFHAALMIATQWLLAHGHFVVDNTMAIQVFAFVVLPSAVYGVVLSIRAARAKGAPPA